MSQAEQAQKGFKTFILTLATSLIVFSAVYYAITNYSSNSSTPDIESTDKVSQNSEQSDSSTVFGQLASQKVTDVQPQAVLAASDTLLADAGNVAAEPTQATGTPSGGVTSITTGLILSTALFLFGMYVISRDPRRLALRGFENSITRDLD